MEYKKICLTKNIKHNDDYFRYKNIYPVDLTYIDIYKNVTQSVLLTVYILCFLGSVFSYFSILSPLTIITKKRFLFDLFLSSRSLTIHF